MYSRFETIPSAHDVLSLIMKMVFWLLLAVFCHPIAVLGQNPTTSRPQTNTAPNDYSGMYSFLKEGEFIQITIEDPDKVSGFISRYGDSPSDKATFLDQFFKSGKLDGKKLSFTTENVHGAWFTFDGDFKRGQGKTPDEESYFILQGNLIRYDTGPDKKTTSQTRSVEFKSFPRDVATPQ